MSGRQSKIRWALAAALLVGLALLLLFVQPWGYARKDLPKDDATPRASPDEPGPPPALASASVIERANPRPSERDGEAAEPECQTDEDCDGPRLADCVRPICKERKCTYDRASCECRTNDECDDGEPCTRDLCFSSTKACIHIRESCE